jgi:hypothetical protein
MNVEGGCAQRCVNSLTGLSGAQVATTPAVPKNTKAPSSNQADF